MDSHSFLFNLLIYLCAAVVTVPVFKRLGLGSVLGYLAAGILIGPWGLSLISNVNDILHFAEFGVVLLLFIIGLELQPSRLWALRRPIFGLGSAQLFITTILLTSVSLLIGLDFKAALAIGLVLSLSSTAFVLQVLAEKNQLTTHHGRTSFAILLFQDMAAVPMLALLPLLGISNLANSGGTTAAVIKACAVVIIVVLAGRFLVHPFFRLIALTKVREISIAAALLIVVGTAMLMQTVGLSMALGAFLAGVILADSEHKHALEADIEPFKGLLLGLFFIAVGMSVDLGLLIEKPVLVLSLAIGLVCIKAIVLYGIGLFIGQTHTTSRNLACFLSQGGEFAFVLVSIAVVAQVFVQSVANLLVLVVSLSMIITALLIAFNDRWLVKKADKAPVEYDEIKDEHNQVIIAGFGRFAQIVARILQMKKIRFTALESDLEQVDFVRKFGNKVYYGDVSRLGLLHSANMAQAKLFVLAVDDVELSVKTAEIVKHHFPHIKIFARAHNRKHQLRLMNIGIHYVVRETLHSSLDMTTQILSTLGLSAEDVEHAVSSFKEHDQQLISQQAQFHQDEEQLIRLAKKSVEELQDLFEEDSKQ